MARDPERITPTLEAIEELWRKYPDMRLGQLIFNLAGNFTQGIEDEVLISRANIANRNNAWGDQE